MLPPVSVPMPAQKMPGGDAVRGSRARSPGPSVERPRVARDGKWLGRVGEPDRELHGRGLPRDHGAGGTQARDDHRVITLAPPRIEHEALRRRGEVDCGHDVFDANGDAVQRAAVVPGLELSVRLLRGLQRGVVGPTQVRPELLVESVGACDRCQSQLDARDSPGTERGGGFSERVGDVAHGWSPRSSSYMRSALARRSGYIITNSATSSGALGCAPRPTEIARTPLLCRPRGHDRAIRAR